LPLLPCFILKDEGSATKGGELGFVSRGDLDPAFEVTALSLKQAKFRLLCSRSLVIIYSAYRAQGRND